MKLTFSLLLTFISALSYASNISGVINQYSKVVAKGGCDNAIVIANPELFFEGEEVILIQMQGASINEENETSNGTVTDLNNTGNYERLKIAVVSNDTLYFDKNIAHPFDYSKQIQVVSFPKYDNATITSELTCSDWNGETGGILAFQVVGVLTFDAPINVSGKGFRGGANTEAGSNSCFWAIGSPDYFYNQNSWEGSLKGEGIALTISGKEKGKGPQANGGGGGNDHNSGGAGGANYADGGIGGENDDPGLFNCTGYNPGLGGKGYNYTSNLAFLGGGGGSGHGNNGLSSPGGNGAGIVIATAETVMGADQRILAKGDDASITAGGDGAGGGGAGGTVLLKIDALGSNFSIDISGGKGGDVDDEFLNRCHGPGGGGAGGLAYVSSSPTTINIIKNGGGFGVVTNSTAACNGSSNNAAAGGEGFYKTGYGIPFGSTEPNCVLTSYESINKLSAIVYPNPSNSEFTLQGFENIDRAEVYDNSGKLIEVIINQVSFGKNYSAGLYFVKIQSNSSSQLVKILKTK